MNLHLTYRYLAIALSEAGFPTLRLDYPGTCDSTGSSRNIGRFPAMIAALHNGADYLKDVTGLSKIAVFGARFGGNLAIELASNRDDVASVALWGVYRSGKQFLRTEATFDRLISANPNEQKPQHWREGDLEAAGFLYRKDLVDDIRETAIDSSPLKSKILCFDWDDKGDSHRAAETLASVAKDIRLAGLHDRGTDSLQTQAVPTKLIQRTVDWLLEYSRVAADAPATTTRQLANELIVDMGPGCAVIERAIHFGEHNAIFGVLTTPTSAEQANTSVLLVNGGNNHRSGINRSYTEWARLWASAGFTVLRMDIRGLGDSPPRNETDLNRLYMEQTVEDVAEAADWLKTSNPDNKLVLCGYCAGAYQALNLARRGASIDGIMLIELLRYYPWEPLQNATTPWKARLLRYWARFHPMWLLHRGQVGRWLRALCTSGVDTMVVYRKDEQMLERFKAEVASVEHELSTSGSFQLKTLSPSNHIISPLFAQAELSDLLMQYLDELRQITHSS